MMHLYDFTKLRFAVRQIFSACGVLMLVIGSHAQQTKPAAMSNPFHSERVKLAEIGSSFISGDDELRDVSGAWVPESNDPAKALVFPEQVKIICTHSENACRELKITLGSIGGMVVLNDIEETIWPIDSWDSKGLLASYGPDAYGSLSEKCHRHVLAMSFTSGAVSTSDIPTHDKGCEMFPETDSYRLASGGYYVDTTPGNDLDKPSEKSVEQLKKAAADGDAEAMRTLGEKYETGRGVPRDYPTAAHWYRMAAEKGNTAAMVDFGVLCGRGNGVQQSYVEEMRWYRKAAEKNNDTAMLYLGHMFRHGDGVPQDYSEALGWYRKSAELGNASALAMVGEMYRDGEGVPQDYAEAYFWLNLAAVDPPPGTRQDRDAVVGRLPRAKLTEIQERCRHWQETHPKIHFAP